MDDSPLAAVSRNFAQLLSKVVGSWSPQEAERVTPDPACKKFEVMLDEGALSARVRSLDGGEEICLRYSGPANILFEQQQLLKKLEAVSNYDMSVVGDLRRDGEIWDELSSTRFLRTIARTTSIPTDYLVRRMHSFEAAARQTYEGSPFVGSIIMAHNYESITQHAGPRFRPFATSLGFGKALLHEKWLRPFLEAGAFALVTTGFKGQVRGFADASTPWQNAVFRGPVERLDGLFGFVKPGISILSASSAGDIHFSVPSGSTFVNSKGEWRYENWTPLAEVLRLHCSTHVVDGLVRLVRSSSYDHRGGLFVVINDEADVLQVVPDHQVPGRPAETLRNSVVGLSVGDDITHKLLNVAAGIDGAVVLGKDGSVLDVACMVTEPNPDVLHANGVKELQRFSGARSTAAWNASVSGIAIKISDDGPIDVYEAGQLVFHSE
jgi:hypothetical protein